MGLKGKQREAVSLVPVLDKECVLKSTSSKGQTLLMTARHEVRRRRATFPRICASNQKREAEGLRP